ncbi:hypothetical protein AURDEDRAFT_178720, partial [Auricularia subglabra TFB-10046 SS5]
MPAPWEGSSPPPPPPDMPDAGAKKKGRAAAVKKAPAAPSGRVLRSKQPAPPPPPPVPPVPPPLPPVPPPPPPLPPKKKPAALKGVLKKAGAKGGTKKKGKPAPKKAAKKVVVVAPESDEDEEDVEADEEDEEDGEDVVEEDTEVPPTPPKKKKKAKAVVIDMDSSSPPKKSSKGKQPVDDVESADDARGKRSSRFSKAREEGDVDLASSKGKKRASPEEDDSESHDVPRKKGRVACDEDIVMDLSHFDRDRKPGPSEAPIPEIARKVIRDNLKLYLPLHYFSDDAIAAERNAPVVVVNGTQQQGALGFAAREENMSFSDWRKWGTRMVAALRRYPLEWIPDMFAEHFDMITTRENVEEKWHVWRAYDIAMRQKVKWPKPANISGFDLATYQDCVANCKDPAPQASSSRGPGPRSGRPSTSGAGPGVGSAARNDGATASMYDRCIVCGKGSHKFNKVKRTPTACAAIWLVWNADKRYYTIRATGRP